MLKKENMPDSVIKHFITLGCLTVGHFANWVDSRGELFDKFIEPTDAKTDPAVLARLKMTWREADAIYAKRLKRTSEGLLEEALDEPLDEGVQGGLEVAIRDKHAWPAFPPDRMGTDTMLGRFHREFLVWKPSLWPIEKTKTLATTQTSSQVAKRHCGGGVSVVVESFETDDSIETCFFYQFMDKLEGTENTWAVAGAFDAKSKDTPGFMAPWPQMCLYVGHIKKEASSKLRDNTEASVLAYTRTVEEKMRCKALEWVRGESHLTWGAALMRATTEHAHIWQDVAHVLVKRRGQEQPRSAPPRQDSTRRPPRGPPRGRRGRAAGRATPRISPRSSGRP